MEIMAFDTISATSMKIFRFFCSRWWKYWHVIWKVSQIRTKKLICFSLSILSLNALAESRVSTFIFVRIVYLVILCDLPYTSLLYTFSILLHVGHVC